MLFLEHAQSDEWDSLLVKKLLVTKRNMRSGSGALSTWGTNLMDGCTLAAAKRFEVDKFIG